jgi:hypothetical protein
LEKFKVQGSRFMRSALSAPSTLPSPGPREGIARLFPGVHPALEGLDIGVAPIQKLLCRPGRSMFLRSSAVKDDLLVLGQVRKLVLELLKDERVFELQAAAPVLIGISAY